MVNIRNEIKEAFEVRANEIGFCLDQRWGQYENPYINNDTALAYNLFKDGWIAANNIRDEELNGCVMVPVKIPDQFTSKLEDHLLELWIGDWGCDWDGFVSVNGIKPENIWSMVVEAARGGK
ncbi:hypothetical protein [Acinetobacter modestus]|uniref:hypothetical protein n=1 Tax=Acinetobacter modestus TaxID=1776740 RepID=UPI00301ACA4E